MDSCRMSRHLFRRTAGCATSVRGFGLPVELQREFHCSDSMIYAAARIHVQHPNAPPYVLDSLPYSLHHPKWKGRHQCSAKPKYANLTGPSSVRWSCREAHSRSSFIVNSIHIYLLQQQLANYPLITTFCGFHQARPSLVPLGAIMVAFNQTLHGLAVHMFYCRPK